MRTRRALATLLLAASLLGGCSRVGGSTRADGRHPWTLPGHVRIGSTDEPDGLDPLYTNTDAADQIAPLLYTFLFRDDPKGEYVPDLALAVPTTANGGISRDAKTITLHLRRGVTWADGAPLDGRDVRFTWRAVMDPANAVKSRVGWDDVTAIDLRDENLTVVLHLREPSVAVLGMLGGGGGTAYPPLPEHLLGRLHSLDRAAFNAAPLASGPFTLARWDHGSSLAFVANPRYWRGRPKLDAITWRVVPNAETLVGELGTHEIDVVADVVETELPRVRAMPGVATVSRLLANYRHLEFDTRKPLLRDPRVRLAIAEGVDWNRIDRTVYRGANERAHSDIVPTSWAAPAIPLYPYDPAAARRLLESAGFHTTAGGFRTAPDGTPLALTISTGTNKPQNVQAEVVMQQALRGLGIDLTIKNYPVSELFAQDGPLYGGRYDLSWSIETNGPDPDNVGVWSAGAIPPHGANTAFLADARITRDALAASRTFDRRRRAALYLDEERRIHELVPAVFLYWQIGVNAHNDDLRGYRPATYVSDQWNAYDWSI